jgi:hypothetical protein
MLVELSIYGNVKNRRLVVHAYSCAQEQFSLALLARQQRDHDINRSTSKNRWLQYVELRGSLFRLSCVCSLDSSSDFSSFTLGGGGLARRQSLFRHMTRISKKNRSRD